MKLWSPADVAVMSFVLGFPAGLALAARNSVRLGRTTRAGGYLLEGAVALLALVLLPGQGRGVAAAGNLGVATYLYWQTGADRTRARLNGSAVLRAGVGGGLVTAIAGWLLLVPAMVVAMGVSAIDDHAAAPAAVNQTGDVPTTPPTAPSTGTPTSPRLGSRSDRCLPTTPSSRRSFRIESRADRCNASRTGPRTCSTASSE